MLIRPGAIGDCILSLPALEHLKTDYTEVWISSPLVPLIQFADCVKSIPSTGLDLVFGDNFPASLKEKLQEFDEIVSWYGAARSEFRLSMDAVHSRCTFLQALPDSGWHEPATDFFLQQVGAANGRFSRLSVDIEDPRRSIVIHPFSGSPSKNWPIDKFRELAACLPADWIRGPDEQLAGAKQFENLFDLAKWMIGASAYLGNDSGISHLAAAIGLPTVALFGPTDPVVWAPRGDNVRIIEYTPLHELPVASVLSELVGCQTRG